MKIIYLKYNNMNNNNNNNIEAKFIVKQSSHCASSVLFLLKITSLCGKIHNA